MKSLLRAFFRFTILSLIRLVYRPDVSHVERIPKTGGVLLICNHTTYIDSFVIYEACPRPVRYVIVSRFMSVPVMGWFLKLFNAIPIEPGKPRDAIRVTAEALAQGDVACIFPEGQLTRTGTLLELMKGYQLIAKKGNAKIVPMFIDGLWDSAFAFEVGRKLWHWRSTKCPVRVAFGEPVTAEEAPLEWAREELLSLSAEAFEGRQELDWPLGEAAVRALKKRPGDVCFIEHGKNRRELKRGQVLATAIALAERWKESLPENEERIGILLPPGWTPALINLALVLTGRVPINLPFDAESLDSESLAGHLHDLGIRSVVTSKAFASQLADFPWRETEGQFIDMGGELNATNLSRVLMERLFARLEPKWLAVRRLGLRDGSRENVCGYLPKGAAEPVLLSSEALIANPLRLTAGDFVHWRERIFCEAPLSTATGTIFSLWLPVLRGTTCSGRSFAMQASRSMIETVAGEDEVTLVVGRDSLIDQLEELKEPWHPEVREAVRAIYCFPESQSDPTLSDRQLDPVESKTGAPVCLGWAPDSIGTVIAASFPDLTVPEGSAQLAQDGRRAGSVGRLLPGSVPKTDEDGTFLLKGAGFDREKPVPTGRKARTDEEDFVFLESKTPEKTACPSE